MSVGKELEELVERVKNLERHRGLLLRRSSQAYQSKTKGERISLNALWLAFIYSGSEANVSNDNAFDRCILLNCFLKVAYLMAHDRHKEIDALEARAAREVLREAKRIMETHA